MILTMPRGLLGGLIAICVFGLLFFWLCQVASVDINQPLSYQGDVLEWLSYFDHDFVANDLNTRLHAPFELDHPQQIRYLYNALFQSNSILIWLAHLAGGDAVRTLNVAYLATFFLVFAIAYWVCSRLALDNPYRFCAASLYALMPYHFLRNQQHFSESCYYLTPLLALLILWLWSARPIAHAWNGAQWKLDWRARYIWMILLLLVCFTSFHPYHQFFFAVLAACVAPLAAMYRNSWRPLLVGSTLALVAIAVLLFKDAVLHALITPELALSVNGQAISNYGDAEQYPLKLAQLMLPVQGHRLPSLAALRATYDAANPLNNENGSTTLGLVGSIGLVACVVLALLPTQRLRMSTPGKMGTIALLALLFAVMGGISSLISIASLALLGPGAELTQTRGWNRIVIFIGFFAYFTAFWLLRSGMQWLNKRLPVIPYLLLVWPVTAAVFAFALWDQVPYKIAQDRDGKYLSDKKFFGQIEASLPAESRIFQLPFLVHHWSAWVQPHVYYTDGLRPFLASQKLHFTYGGDLGTPQLQWLHIAAELPAEQAAPYLCRNDFAGVLVQQNMLENPAGFQKPWTSLLGEPLTSDDQNYAFFDLRAFCEVHAPDLIDLHALKTKLEEDARNGRHFIPAASLDHRIGRYEVAANLQSIGWMSTSNEDGWLAFGPREPLRSGSYRAIFKFSGIQAISAPGSVNMDINASVSAHPVILGARHIEADGERRPVSESLDFRVTREMSAFEYRVTKPQGVEVHFDGVEVQRLSD